ncbi:hypothetical protein KKF34_02815 [Myxococcota bacterium]|nr:hypothetical protein [Myxococcota bacterium]MBU1379574.1 hypothetical protein [Myxococcota bacterium]MBU1495793.1 hypothetical protein [Myxococcota bacterium]
MLSTDKSVRLANRLLRVIERHSNAHPAMSISRERTLERTNKFINDAQNYMITYKERSKERKEGLGAVSDLEDALRSFVPMISNIYPHLKINLTNLTGTTPDDTLTFTDIMMEEVQMQPDFETNTMAKDIMNNVSTAWQTAMKEWTEYENADSNFKAASEALNTSKALFHGELTMMRRTLAAVIGRTHPDVRKLTVQSSTTKDIDDPPENPTPAI